MSILRSKNINLNDTIEIAFPKNPDYNINDKEIIIIEVVHVYDWYDEVINLEGICQLKDNIIQIKIENTLEQGLYLILCLKKQEGKIIAGKTHDTTRLLDAFIVEGKSENNPIAMYQSVVNNRNAIFDMPKNDIENANAKPFDICLFCKNINVDVKVQYGDIELIPYKNLHLISEIEYINSFLSEIVTDLKFDEKQYASNLPTAVLRIKNILALSDNEAVDYAIKRATLINDLFTLMMQGNGSFFAVVVFDKRKHAAQLRPIQSHYKGNLLKLINQGHYIRTYYDALKDTDSYIKLYIKLLTDAMNEDDQMIKYYRLWIVLEGIAAIKNYEKDIMKKWNGDIVYNNKGNPIYIDNKALNIVFELVRRSSLFSEDFFKVEKITTPKEFLSVCYQRRCCAAHHGSCVSNDSIKCIASKAEMKRCSENRIIHGNPRDVFSDKILWNLQQLTFSIVKLEIEQQFGKERKANEYILKLINEE